MQEDLSDDEAGPAVTSQPIGAAFSVPPSTENATEVTSLNPSDKISYTPGKYSI